MNDLQLAEPFEITIREAQQSRLNLQNSRLEENNLLRRTSGFEDALQNYFPFVLDETKVPKSSIELITYSENLRFPDQETENQTDEAIQARKSQGMSYTQRVEENFQRYLGITPDIIRQKAVEWNYEDEKECLRDIKTKEKIRKGILRDPETTIKKEYHMSKNELEDGSFKLNRQRIGDQIWQYVARVKQIRGQVVFKGSRKSRNVQMGSLNPELVAIYDFAFKGKGNVFFFVVEFNSLKLGCSLVDNFLKDHAHLEEKAKRREENAIWDIEQMRCETHAPLTPLADRTNLARSSNKEKYLNLSHQ